jgi:hypothetical protein
MPKSDMSKYIPSLATVLQYTSPEATAERRRKARENFGRPTPVPATEAKDDSQRSPPDGPLDPDHVSVPSPWAAQAPGLEIDPAALPSAGAPAANSAPAAMAPKVASTRSAGAVQHARQRARKTWIIVGVCVAIAVVAPILMVAIAMSRNPAGQGAGTPASATASVTAMRNTAGGTSAPMPPQPNPTAAATVEPTAPTPSMASSGAPHAPAPSSAPPSPKPRGSVDDPYAEPTGVPKGTDAAAPPPSAAPAPPASTPAPVFTSTTPFEGKPVF